MGENVGHKTICRTRSINPKKIFAQNVGKLVRLTQHADIAFLHQNISQLGASSLYSLKCLFFVPKKQACQTVQRTGTKIFASNIVANILAKFVPCAAPFVEQLLS